MKKVTGIVKTIVSAIAAAAIVPCGMLTAQAVQSDNTYAVVSGVSCILVLDHQQLNREGVGNTVSVRVPAGSRVFAQCLNGEGYVPLTHSKNTVGRDFYAHPTEVSSLLFVNNRLAPSAPAPRERHSSDYAATVKHQVREASTEKTSTPQTSSSHNQETRSYTRKNQKSVVNVSNGKADSTTTVPHTRSASSAAATTDSESATSEGNQSINTDNQTSLGQADTNAHADSSTPSSDNTVEGKHISAAQYAAANLSLVDRMGGAGTLAGIVILGLIAAAGAISLARSIILG